MRFGTATSIGICPDTVGHRRIWAKSALALDSRNEWTGHDGHTAPNRRIPIEPALVDVIEFYLDTVGEDARQPGHPAGAVLPGRVRAQCRGGITTIGGT